MKLTLFGRTNVLKATRGLAQVLRVGRKHTIANVVNTNTK